MAETGGDKTKLNGEVIAFTGYLSVWKLFGCAAFWLCCLYVPIFGHASEMSRYKWIFEPWALPLRVVVTLGGFVLLVVTLRLLATAVMNKPAIRVQDRVIGINYWKVGTFSLSEVDGVGVISSGEGFYIGVKGKKYGVAPMFCCDGKTLKLNMEKLKLVVLAQAGSI